MATNLTTAGGAELPAELPPPKILGVERDQFIRQIILLVGLAATVALAVWLVLWARTPSYQQLLTGVSDREINTLVEGLQKVGIPYKLEPGGAILVPTGQVHEARIKLAAQGLPKSAETGFETLQEQQPFGTTEFMESARYQRALEGELARSISTLSNVQSARVHLAIPKQSAFVRNRQKPTASVLVNMSGARALDQGQVAAIIHLVASSVPNLEAERVTIVDQRGRLQTSPETNREAAATATQFEYTRRLESAYVERIEDILTPVVGTGNARAQVTADLDFTVTEQAQERYNKEPVLRSEQTAEDKSTAAAVAGIPGALSNQPPGAGNAPETTAATPPPAGTAGAAAANAAANAAAESSAAASKEPSSLSTRATRNFEIDKTVSHTRMATGNVRRLNVAVVVDHSSKTNEDGEVVREARTPEELARITSLVREAVGFSEQRGDSVTVTNVSFVAPPVAEPLPEQPIWQQPWVLDVGKHLLVLLAIMAFVIYVVRPALRQLFPSRPKLPPPPPLVASGPSREQLELEKPREYEEQLRYAKTLVQKDAKRVAQVVRNWVQND